MTMSPLMPRMDVDDPASSSASNPVLRDALESEPAETRPAEAEGVSDPTDFEAVVTRFEGPLLRYADTLLGAGSEQAQDAVQEAFFRLHRQIEQGKAHQIDHLQAWLFRVTHNIARDIGRRRQRHQRAHAVVRQQAEAEPGRGVAQEPGAPERLMHREALACATQELANLPNHLREVIHLKIIQGLTLRQIGAITGLTVGNAGYRLNQGLQRLAERLKARGAI